MDIHVGERVRTLREWRGLSRVAIARELNISYQQLQKYETGQNRISAGRLPQIARLLGTHIAYFFEGLPEPSLPESVDTITSSSPTISLLGLTAECRAMLKLFVRIRNPKIRKSVIEFVLSLNDKGDVEP